jgi:thiol-disulfide isomerase/thioredoxin
MTDFFKDSKLIVPLENKDFNNGRLVDSDIKFSDKTVCVLFFAPWCGHCKMFKPIFVEASEILFDRSNIIFASFDCAQNGMDKINDFGVRGFPTVVLFRNGKFFRIFKDSRTTQKLLNFVNQ